MKRSITDPQSSFHLPQRYLSWIRNTTEKTALQRHIREEYLAGNLSLQPGGAGRHILDAGCGLGANSLFLARLFKGDTIQAVDRSPAQLSGTTFLAPATGNLIYYCSSIEEWQPPLSYDFILVSHVLQYIDSPLVPLVKKILSLLKSGGEAWFVQQTRRGMAEIVAHQRQFLTDNPRFRAWLTFEDYLPIIQEIAAQEGAQWVRSLILPTKIAGFNFANPTPEDRLRLEFILCLDEDGLVAQPPEFLQQLAELKIGRPSRISHPNGIIKVRVP